jgi:hypothetical protein
MYTIKIVNEEGETVELIGLDHETMTTVVREVLEQLHNLIDGYTLVVTKENE